MNESTSSNPLFTIAGIIIFGFSVILLASGLEKSNSNKFEKVMSSSQNLTISELLKTDYKLKLLSEIKTTDDDIKIFVVEIHSNNAIFVFKNDQLLEISKLE